MSDFALSVENVSVAFGATQALSNVDFQVRPGEVRALLGANGAGKSTLIKVITGVTRPNSGFLKRNGSKYLPANPEAARADGVHAVFQELSIFPHLSVLENIFAGELRTRGGILLDNRAMESLAAAALDNLGHNIPLRVRAGDLSISNQQIVEIVRVTVNGARVLLLDEPTSSLNAADRDRLFQLIRVLKSQGTAIVYISHFLSEVLQIADTYTVLRDGKVAQSGNTADTNEHGLSEAMFGRKISLDFRRSAATPAAAQSKPLLQVSQLSTQHVRQVSFAVNSGEVLGIFGLIDCGATELMQALFGLRSVTGGSVRLPGLGNGEQSAIQARWRRKGVGMVPEERPAGLAMSRTVGENVVAVDWSRAGGFGLVFPRKLSGVARQFVQQFGIKCRDGNQPLGELSGGNQQKAALARFAATDVDVVLLSEPTRGVDIAARLDLWRYIDGLAAAGKAVVVVTTDVEEVLALSNTVMVMRRGQLLPTRHAASSVTPEELMVVATGGNQ